MVQLVRLTDDLPQGFDALMALATTAGYGNMARPADEIATSSTAFIALLAAMNGKDLAGIGGMTLEPEPAPEPTIRLRRLYVAPSARRTGIARTLVSALLQEAWDQVDLVSVHAGTEDAAHFWQAQGFAAISNAPWSQQARRSG
ncbi:MAG: GNAT family N-acetyltransferase [Phenylobacterium zucineum]|nr:MAG: GNAT family N-acetyltransferase [Phenylobacterium zucineum]